jgi:hypothetical protein
MRCATAPLAFGFPFPLSLMAMMADYSPEKARSAPPTRRAAQRARPRPLWCGQGTSAVCCLDDRTDGFIVIRQGTEHNSADMTVVGAHLLCVLSSCIRSRCARCR